MKVSKVMAHWRRHLEDNFGHITHLITQQLNTGGHWFVWSRQLLYTGSMVTIVRTRMATVTHTVVVSNLLPLSLTGP